MGNFADCLTGLLKARHFTVQDLAILSGMSRPTVYRHRDGTVEPNAVQRSRYAEAFGMTLRELDELWQQPAPPTADMIRTWPDAVLDRLEKLIAAERRRRAKSHRSPPPKRV